MVTLCPKSEAGFSLLEILVVLALLGLLSGLVSGSLRTAIVAGPHLVRTDIEAEELEDVCSFLRRLLSQSRPISIGNDGEESVRFHGTSDRVEFLAPLAQRFGPADIVSYALNIRDGHTLQLTWHLDREDNLRFAAIMGVPDQVTEMLTGVQNASFQYFGCGQNRGRSGWWSNWTEQPTLPAMIRVQFQWRGRDESIIIALRIEAASGFSTIVEPACLN